LLSQQQLTTKRLSPAGQFGPGKFARPFSFELQLRTAFKGGFQELLSRVAFKERLRKGTASAVSYENPCFCGFSR
jgi:hypothetical protein